MIRTANLIGSVSRKAGGLHASVRRLVQSLAVTGVGVRVLAVEDEFTNQDLAVWSPVPVDVFGATWPQDFGYSPGFIKVLNEYRPDLTHTHGVWMYPSIATAAYCTRRRVPYMISPHGMLDPWAIRHHRWKKVLAYAIFETNHVQGARCIRALCDSEARDIRQLKLKNPVAVIPNGVDLPQLQRSEVGGQRSGISISASQAFSFSDFRPQGRKVLLYLGRLHPKKNLAALLKAWAQVQKSEVRSQKSNDWVLAIAGWDQAGYEAQLRQLTSDLGLASAEVRSQTSKVSENVAAGTAAATASVVFLGARFGVEKDAVYRACEAFILPSLSEGLPMAVLEAWAYAKPVLMTPECNLTEGFETQAAVRIDSTVESIVQGLRTLWEAPEATLLEMGGRGRTLVEQRFTWPKIAAQVKATYEWMLGGSSKPDWMFNEQS